MPVHHKYCPCLSAFATHCPLAISSLAFALTMLPTLMVVHKASFTEAGLMASSAMPQHPRGLSLQATGHERVSSSCGVRLLGAPPGPVEDAASVAVVQGVQQLLEHAPP